MPIKNLCFRNAVTINKDASLIDAARRMKVQRVGALLVTAKGKKPIGILTDRDIVVNALAEGLPVSTAVWEVMKQDVLCVPDTAGVADVIEKMEKKEVRRAAVVNRNGGVCGMVSSDDLIQLLGNELNSLGKLIDHQLANENIQPELY